MIEGSPPGTTLRVTKPKGFGALSRVILIFTPPHPGSTTHFYETAARAMCKNGVRRSSCPLLFGTLRGRGPLPRPFWKPSFSAYSTGPTNKYLYATIKEATEDEAEPGLIRLDDNHAWPISIKTGMQLIVRECYPRMFELSQQLAKVTRGGGGVVFSGNPGIGKGLDYLFAPFSNFSPLPSPPLAGKTWFLNYTLWRLLQQNKTVLVESIAQHKVWLFKEGRVQAASREDKKQVVEIFQTVEHDTDACYLFDPCGDIPREPLEIRPFTVVTASPNPQHYKQFYKRTSDKYCVPCWSWEELKKHVSHAAQTVAPVCWRGLLGTGLTMDEAYDHFKIFGGIPSDVYQTRAQAKRTKAELDAVIHQLDMRALSLVINDLETVRYYQGQLSHQVLRQEADPETFKSKGIRYASDYVRDAVYERKLKNNQSELGRAIHELRGALVGDIFERYATSRLASGECFRIYPLHPDGKAAWLRIPARSC
ncbi:hypothetical protein QOT17_006761 [Balamuthia mandrillaris]